MLSCGIISLSIYLYLLRFHHGDAVTIKLFIFKEVSYMIIFGLTFIASIGLVTSVITFIVTSMQALLSFGALLVFAFVALAIGTHSRMAWTAMFLTIVAMVAVETLAPYSAIIARVLAVIIAGIATYFIKTPVLRYVRRDQRSNNPRLSTVIRTVLRII